MSKPGSAPPLENESERSDIKKFGCARCGALFECGMNGPEPCWCARYPRVMPVPQPEAGCYCPACLADVIAQRLPGSGVPPV